MLNFYFWTLWACRSRVRTRSGLRRCWTWFAHGAERQKPRFYASGLAYLPSARFWQTKHSPTAWTLTTISQAFMLEGLYLPQRSLLVRRSADLVKKLSRRLCLDMMSPLG